MNNNYKGENDNIRQVIERRLELEYNLYKHKHTIMMIIRQWFITVLIAFLSVIISKNLINDAKWLYWMPLIIALMFWYLEIINQYFSKTNMEEIEKFGIIIIEKDYDLFYKDGHFVDKSNSNQSIWYKSIKLCKTAWESKYGTGLGFYFPILLLIYIVMLAIA